MKVCLYYKPITKPWGGSNSFILSLKNYFIKQGVELTHDINGDYDILFLNSAYKAPGKFINYKEIIRVKERGYSSFFRQLLAKKKNRSVKILYRLDGLRRIYASMDSKMDRIQLNCVSFADQLVFQSDFALEMFRECGYKGNNFSIVYNGVNQDIFNMIDRVYWDNKSVLKIIACSWSSNPAKGHKIVAELSGCEGVEVSFIGAWAQGISSGNVRLLGGLSQNGIAEEFRKHHVFVFPSLNEACSNILLEALSAGLPVLYLDSGSNEEIAGNYGVKLRNSDLAKSLDEIKSGYSSLMDNIKRDINKFSIESAGRQYLEICKSM